MTRKAGSFNHEHCSCVAGLEHELSDLRRRLSDEEKPRRKPKSDSWLDNLPSADRKFFERKLGKAGRGSIDDNG